MTLAAHPTDQHPTNQHYDLDPRVFGVFLDPSRKYSSGWYTDPADPDGESLEAAQQRKMDLVAGLVRARPGARILDIGSGWGALVLHLAGERGCDVTGISPAPKQAEFVTALAAERRLAARARVVTGSFEEAADLPRGLDAVTALGSVVHMPDLPAVFAKARGLLRREGRMYVSESCFRNAAIRDRFDAVPGTRFVRSTVFGNGELRPLSELVSAAEDAGFSIETTLDLTAHYRRTIVQWIEGVRRGAAELDAVEEGMAARLEHYLEVANAGWGYTTKHYALVLRNAR